MIIHNDNFIVNTTTCCHMFQRPPKGADGLAGNRLAPLRRRLSLYLSRGDLAFDIAEPFMAKIVSERSVEVSGTR